MVRVRVRVKVKVRVRVSTIRIRDSLDVRGRCSLMMQIVYTQTHDIYYLSRVRKDDDKLIEKGERTR